MKLFNKIIITTAVILVSFALTIDANAQCKRYTKKYCLPSLSPYMHNGQLTSAILNPGDSADVEMTFNAGKEYRILVCNQEQIGKVQFKILDKSRKILYKSDPESHHPFWDFKVENTQQFIIQLTVPPMVKNVQKLDLVPNGCVSLLVGFKE